MRSTALRLLGLTASLAVLAGCGAGVGDDDGADEAAVTAKTGVSIVGHQLMRNGKAWAPKGLSMIGSLTCGSANTAYSHWGQAELNAAKSFGADVLRFQVSQPYLDPQGSKYQASYLTKIQNMVSLATQNGFAVILSMQDQALACGDADPLPTASTERAWGRLAPVFATNPSVIYELYNEPQNNADAAGWKDWGSGKSGTVGMQALLTYVRGKGAKNVIFVDGARFAEVLTGIPILKDPLNQLGYATHPYWLSVLDKDANAFEERFGFLAADHVVLITEWSENTSLGSCSSTDVKNSQKLLAFAKSKGIGVFGWALDDPGTIVQDFSWTPTNSNAWVCGKGDNGIGAMLKQYFLQG